MKNQRRMADRTRFGSKGGVGLIAAACLAAMAGEAWGQTAQEAADRHAERLNAVEPEGAGGQEAGAQGEGTESGDGSGGAGGGGDPMRLIAPGDATVTADWLAGLEQEGFLVENPTVLGEGAFVTAARGAVVRGPAERLMFRFDLETPAGPRPVAMLLVPSVETDLIRAGLPAGRIGTDFVISGQVLLYRGRNYLIPSASRLLAGVDEEADGVAGPAGGPAGGLDRGMTNAAEDAEEPGAAVDPLLGDETLLDLASEIAERMGERDFDAAGELARIAEEAGEAAADGETRGGSESEVVSLPVNEQGMLSRRPARLMRTALGGWGLSFDNDGDVDPAVSQRGPRGNAAEEAVVVPLVPCRLVESMEARQERSARPIRVLVSGRILRSQSGTMVLPTIFRILETEGVSPLQ